MLFVQKYGMSLKFLESTDLSGNFLISTTIIISTEASSTVDVLNGIISTGIVLLITIVITVRAYQFKVLRMEREKTV